MTKNDVVRREALEFQEGMLRAIVSHRHPYPTRIKDVDYVMFPDVINPNYSKASRFFLDHLGVRKGDVVLDPFTGSGVDAIFAVLQGAERAVAIDKFPMPVLCARYNAVRLGLDSKVDVYQGDLFQPLVPPSPWPLIPHRTRAFPVFDLVVANPPFKSPDSNEFHYEKRGVCSSELEAAVNDPSYETLQTFFEKVGRHLKPNGRIRMVFSDVGDMDYMLSLAKRNGFKPRVVAQTKYGSSVRIHVYEMRRK